MRRKVLSRVVLAATAVALCATAAPAAAPRRIAAKGWGEPVLISKTHTGKEISLAINPRDERQLAVCGPSGFPAVEFGHSHFHRSADGGTRWSLLDVETALADTRSATFEGGDCDVAYDAGGTLWTADTWLGNLSIGHSRDGRAFDGAAVSTPAAVVDRPWLVGGPPGTAYVTYQDVQCCMPSAIWFMKTTDYGKTFTPPAPVTAATPDGAYTWQGNLVVANGGRDLYLPYARRAYPFNTPTPNTVELAASRDGGATWTSRQITRLPSEMRSLYPSLAIDAGGYLHAVWSEQVGQDEPAFYTMSKDRGATWSRPRQLNPGEWARGPWVAGGKKGQARVAWLGSHRPSGGGFYFGYAKVDNGRTVAMGPTTRQPLWTGDDSFPEFVMARLDKQGRMHIAMTVQHGGDRRPRPDSLAPSPWAFYYQRESGGR